MGRSTLERDYDIGRSLADYLARIRALERRVSALFGSSTPQSVATQGCRVTRNASQSITNSTVTIINFNAEITDNNVMHDNATNNSRITINVPGIYVVGFSGELATAAVYTRVIASLLLNGATMITRNQYAGTTTDAPQRIETSTVRRFAAGDYIEVQVFQTSTATRNLTVNTEYSPIFYAARIGGN